jgi:hypothetical protein
MPHRSIYAPPLPSILAQDPFQHPPVPTTRDLFAPPPPGVGKPPNRGKEVLAAVRAATALSHAAPEHYTTTSVELLPNFEHIVPRKSCKFVEKHHKTARFDHVTTNEVLMASPRHRAVSSMEVFERARPIRKPCVKGLLEHTSIASADDFSPFLSMQRSVEAQREQELAALVRKGTTARPLPCIPRQELSNPISFTNLDETKASRSRAKVEKRTSPTPTTTIPTVTNTSDTVDLSESEACGMVSSYQQHFRPKVGEPVGRVVHTIAFLRKQKDLRALGVALPPEDAAPRQFLTTNQDLMFRFAKST